MTYYVTKYALTMGILRVHDGTIVDNKYLSAGEGYRHLFINRTDWFDTLEAAQARVREMRAKRIASARKTIKKLEAELDAPAKVSEY